MISKMGVNALSISPRDSYMITCEKFTQGGKNLIIWDCVKGREIAEFEWRKTSKEGTKSIKFTNNEKFCARFSSKTQIDIYENGNFLQPKVTINANEDTLAKKGKKQQ